MSNLIQYIIQKDPSKKSLSDLFTNRVVDDYKKPNQEITKLKNQMSLKTGAKKQRLILTNI